MRNRFASRRTADFLRLVFKRQTFKFRIIFFLTLAMAMDQPLTYVAAAIFGALVGAFVGWRSGGNAWKGARSGMLLFQVLLFLLNVLYVISALSDPANFSFIQ